MPDLETRRPKFLRGLASFAFAFSLLSAFGSDVSAQAGGGLRAHYQRFYGQDFYGRGIHGHFPPLGPNREYRGYYYGPAQMYGREYGEQYGYATAPPFVRPRPLDGTGFIGY